ncbi:hypothetical protein V4F39_23845 [Aquincola sp. MAHUQ-54]|uniref:Copper chaperone PCu(A)C n=1 Tax=Aquincola agrisoli TaxID=3119538 RepID=A0AAW9QLF1_9BURK
MRKHAWLHAALAGTAAAFAAVAQAHEPADPKYGGQVVVAAHLDFEIVQRDNDLVFYIEDHSELVPTEGAQGKVAIAADGEGAAVELKPLAPNMLVASGVSLKPGDQVAVSLLLQRPADITFHFSLGADGQTMRRVAMPGMLPAEFPRFR